MANSTSRGAHLGVVLGGLVSFALGGCTSQLPLVSHAHVGHAMTTWHDTPGQSGLLLVAAEDLGTAEHELELACADTARGLNRAHMANVLHALLPDAQPLSANKPPGTGYGAVRAFAGAVEHLEFAATSRDASLNLVTAIMELSNVSEPILARLATTVELARASLEVPLAEQRQYCQRVRRELGFALGGTPEIAAGSGDFRHIGFSEFVDRLQTALDRESNPGYAPVKRRYLLGLVRLPNGEWRYRLPRQGEVNRTYSSFGY